MDALRASGEDPRTQWFGCRVQVSSQVCLVHSPALYQAHVHTEHVALARAHTRRLRSHLPLAGKDALFTLSGEQDLNNENLGRSDGEYYSVKVARGRNALSSRPGSRSGSIR